MSPAYIFATIIAAVLGGVGVSLPFIQNDTWAYMEHAHAGLQGWDPVALVVFVGLVVLVVVARSRSWRPDGVLLVTGAGLLFIYGLFFNRYRDIDVVIQPGMYLVLASAVLFVLIGAGGFLNNRVQLDIGGLGTSQRG